MSIELGVDEMLDGGDDPLIRNGRYQIVAADGTKPSGWTRATGWADTFIDKFHIQKWDKRMVATGVASRPDLLALVAATPPGDKRRLDELCEQAKEAAKGNAGANTGSALHTLTERVDSGEDVFVPPPWDADIDAYKAALRAHAISIHREWMEKVVCVPELKVAGRFDRLVTQRGATGGLLTVADLKTAQELYPSAWVSIAIQLALYAHAETVYDPATKKHTPMPTVDRSQAIVIHLPAGQGRCDLYGVDIEAGWEMALLAGEVRRARNTKVAAPLASFAAPVLLTVVVDEDLFA